VPLKKGLPTRFLVTQSRGPSQPFPTLLRRQECFPAASLLSNTRLFLVLG